MARKIVIYILAIAATTFLTACPTAANTVDHADKKAEVTKTPDGSPVTVGAAQTERYLSLLDGKKVALFSNHTGIVDGRHTLDLLLDNGVDVKCVFSPEHGFRGTADAGQHISSSVDEKTGIAIASLYDGKRRGPDPKLIDSLDVIVVDIQDVGLRYYTYYASMIELMNAAARAAKKIIVLDRPNPNGMTVDGPTLDMRYRSGVGRLPIPVVHGMTLGELALMANGEGWLDDSMKVDLTVVRCLNYTHQTRYRLPVAPSPNLRTMTAIYLYPSLCYFEATPVSLGRGTDSPFMVYGHPEMKGRAYSFTPRSMSGAKKPPQMGKLCHGVDLSGISDEEAIAQGINLEYLIDAYRDLDMGDKFFTSFFELLIGRGDIRRMIERGMSAEEIKATWADDVKQFKNLRKPYLLYPE